MDIKIERKHWVIRYKFHLLVALLFLTTLVYLLVYNSGNSRLRVNLNNLTIVEVAEDKFIDYLEVEGIAQAKFTLKINSLESGTVSKIVAEEGSTLEQGDTILTISNLELQRMMDDEKDELQKKTVQYQEKFLQMERKTSELKRSTLKTQYELNRLSKQYSLDKEEYDIGIKSKAQLNIASDEFIFNQKNTELLLTELKHDSLTNIIQLELMKNDLKREEKRFIRNKERLDGLAILAPIKGQLSFLSLIPGERVGAGANIGEMKVVDELKITTHISEYYIDRVTSGLPAFIHYLDRKYELKITKVNPEIKDREFSIDLTFVDSIPDNIRIGKNYRVQIEMGKPEEALVFDKGSFYQTTGGQWIFKVNESRTKATKVDIVIGRQNPRQYELVEGLNAGDKVIISGYDNWGTAQEIILK